MYFVFIFVLTFSLGWSGKWIIESHRIYDQKVKQPRYYKYIYFPPVVVVGDVDVVVGDVDVVVGVVDSVVGIVDVVVDMVGINDASPVVVLWQIWGQKLSMILAI